MSKPKGSINNYPPLCRCSTILRFDAGKGFKSMLFNYERTIIMDDRSDQSVIVFHGQVLDGYNGDIASVVIVDVGPAFRLYHAHGYYTLSKTIFNTPFTT